ncbi:MAG TPA: hypothetical protein VEX65_09975, partial [Flavisolibacter sp.]|nr:hypothetical protein [Flavisolibacter sp.]
MFLTTNRLLTSLFVLMLAGAALFSMERVLFADASFILFRIINSDSLQIQEHRFGSFITQGVPLLAARLQLPLETIVVLYSTSFTLFYLLVVLLLLYRFKEQELAVLMGLYFLLFVSETWFWMNNEVHQGIAWMFLFFAVIRWLGRKNSHWIISYPVFIILAILTLFTHPLILFPASYLWLFYCSRKDWPYTRSSTVLFSCILLLIAAVKLYLSTGNSSSYDAEKLQSIRHISWQNIVEAFHSPLVKELPKQMLLNYWLVPVLFITGVLAAWKQNARLLMALTVSYTGLYFLALCMTFRDFLPFYTESELMPATIFLAVPFVYCALPQVTARKQVLILAVIILVRLGYIASASQKWTDRKEWLMQTLETMRRQHTTKGIMYETETNKKLLLLNWGTPCESIIASALKGDKPQLTFVVAKPGNTANRLPLNNEYMIAGFEVLHYS